MQGGSGGDPDKRDLLQVAAGRVPGSQSQTFKLLDQIAGGPCLTRGTGKSTLKSIRGQSLNVLGEVLFTYTSESGIG